MRLPEAVAGLTEETSVVIAPQIQWVQVAMPEASVAAGSLATSYVCQGAGLPVVLLPGFDSSLLEFRRLMPLLAKSYRVYAMDLAGFGFCDRTALESVNPALVKQHLKAFCEQVVKEPIVLVGASMGGGVAIDFATSYPEKVTKLVLIDAVGFATSSGPGRLMVPPLDKWATDFLRSVWVRRKISERAYYDKSFVTPDAEICASLHVQMPNWAKGLISFTKSGGYNFLKDKITLVSQETLVLWGRQDQILGTKDATRFEQSLSKGKLIWIENCGHVPHLEQAKVTARHIVNFLS
ncbi:hydrolase, alpha/beta fold family, putative [Synechococcus sp. PCC 7335]|uniref:alpha/beta fold hydrolase n=1 Tax=Synechococcus sp. (strain ATCC 29403 / PCC 7335) TaxID=91464 RepID=UPI00017EC3FE|nr:alpha/beta fold hydrolase [Synechococcus sp. PCC 7335]EDX85501.1 hydrolase, alpha/beta fold family, putative [Synechococcus sp. PCC 7335]